MNFRSVVDIIMTSIHRSIKVHLFVVRSLKCKIVPSDFVLFLQRHDCDESCEVSLLFSFIEYGNQSFDERML